MKNQMSTPPLESLEHLSPAFRAAIIWMENVLRLPIFTRYGFRTSLASGVVLCRLLNAIEPTSIRRINQFHNRAAATDNLAQFLEACEVKFGIPQSRMFSIYDFQDIFDQEIEVNTEQNGGIKRSEKVVITLFWLAKSLDRKGCFSHLPKLDYTAFSDLLPKTLIHSKLFINSCRSSIGSGDAVDAVYGSSRTLSSGPPRQTSLSNIDQSAATFARSQQVERLHSFSVMGNSPIGTPSPHSSTSVNQVPNSEEIGTNLGNTTSLMNGDTANRNTSIRYSSIVIERMPQPVQPVSPAPPSTGSGHAEIVIISPLHAEVQETSASETEPEVTPLAVTTPASCETPTESQVQTRIRTHAGSDRGLSRQTSCQSNNNMVDDEEAWQTSLSDWKERRRRRSRPVDLTLASVVAQQEAEESRRLEEARERVRRMKSHWRQFGGTAVRLPMEQYSLPPGNPDIALLTGGAGFTLAEVTEEPPSAPASAPVAVLESPAAAAISTGNQSVHSQEPSRNQDDDAGHMTDEGTSLSHVPRAEVNGHLPSTVDHASLHKSSPAGKPESIDQVSTEISSDLEPSSGTPSTVAPAEEAEPGDEFRLFKFLLQCKPSSSETRWGLTMRADGSGSTAPFVVDHVKIGSSADISDINKEDILIDINGQHFGQTKLSSRQADPLPSLEDLHKIMDILSESKKPISVQFLRRTLKSDDFSDSDPGEDSSPIISQIERPAFTETNDGGSDINEQVSVQNKRFVDIPVNESKQAATSADNGHADSQCTADASPNESLHGRTDTEPKEKLELQQQEAQQQSPPPQNEKRTGGDESFQEPQTEHPVPGKPQVDIVYFDNAMDLQWLQSSPGDGANTAVMQTPSCQSVEDPVKSQPAFDMSVRHGRATLVDPSAHMNLAASMVSVEVRHNHQVRGEISMNQTSSEVLSTANNRAGVETVLVDTSITSPVPSSCYASLSPLPPPPHPLISHTLPSPISFVTFDGFQQLSDTVRFIQPGTENQGIPFIPSALMARTDSPPPGGIRDEHNSITLPSPPPPNYFTVGQLNDPARLVPLPHTSKPASPGLEQGLPPEHNRRTDLPQPSPPNSSGVSILTLPPKGFTASGDIHQPGLLPKPPAHPQPAAAHLPRGPSDPDPQRVSLPAPTSPLSLRRSSQTGSRPTPVYSHPRPPVQQRKGHDSAGYQVDRRGHPTQPRRIPLDRGVNPNSKCNACNKELGTGDLMIVYSMSLYYHLACFVCARCGVSLGDGLSNADVRIRSGLLYCEPCYPSRRRTNAGYTEQPTPDSQLLPREIKVTFSDQCNDRRPPLPRQHSLVTQHNPSGGGGGNADKPRVVVISRNQLGKF